MTEQNDNQLERVGDFVYAAAMLKRTPRSGFAFLGSGKESVAEHSCGAAIIGMVLAKMAGANIHKTVLLCLLHDLAEAATGDFNYVNHMYDKCNTAQALQSICNNSGLEEIIYPLFEEFETKSSPEALLAQDADQLDMICSLKRELAHGNAFAEEWLKSAVKRVKTETGKKLCEALMELNPWHWWYDQADEKWWIDRSTDKDK